MSVIRNTMLMQDIDNVAVATENIACGESTIVAGETITALQDIPRGHKIARCDIRKGEPVKKYGRTIGIASADIKLGDWVHSHNVEDITEDLEVIKQQELEEKLKASGDAPITPFREAPKLSRTTFKGYRRPNGDVGIRNNVVVISIIQCANTAAQKIASACDVACVTHGGGCLEFPDRLDDLIKGLSIAGSHPNTYGALIVSLGCQQINPDWIAEPIAAAGREVHKICLQTDGGFYKSVAEGIRLVNEMKARAALQEREDIPVSELVMGSHCGGSDWTSGLSANRICGAMLDIHEAMGGTVVHTAGRGNLISNCGSLDMLERMIETGNRFRAYNKTRNGKGMSETNPTPGNKKGGLTTLEEKNLGTFESVGHGKFRGWLEVGDRAPGKGCWAIDQCHGNNDSFETTGTAMGGAHFVLFTTGRGTMIGNACAPTFKITGNIETFNAMPEFFDYLGADVLNGTKSLEEASVEAYELLLDCADGKLTASEVLGDRSWSIPHAKTLNGEYKEELARCPARE